MEVDWTKAQARASVRATARISVVVLVAGLALSACQTAQKPEEEQVFGRVDCQRAEGRPDLLVQYEQAVAICKGRAEASAATASAAIPVGSGMGGAIASGMQRGMTESQVGISTAISCMAELGYIRRTRSEHLRVCAELKAHESAKMTPKPKVRR